MCLCSNEAIDWIATWVRLTCRLCGIFSATCRGNLECLLPYDLIRRLLSAYVATPRIFEQRTTRAFVLANYFLSRNTNRPKNRFAFYSKSSLQRKCTRREKEYQLDDQLLPYRVTTRTDDWLFCAQNFPSFCSPVDCWAFYDVSRAM